MNNKRNGCIFFLTTTHCEVITLIQRVNPDENADAERLAFPQGIAISL